MSNQLGKQRVLIVEDDPASAGAMAGILKRFSLDTVIAGGVRNAIDAIDAATKANLPFQRVVLDLMLPDGDGGQVLAHLRSRNLECTVCVVTATSDSALLDGLTALKPRCILRKPIDMGELLGGLNLSQ